MEQIVVQLTDQSKRDFFLELLDSLDFVRVVGGSNGKGEAAKPKPKRLKLSPKKRALVEDIKEALREVELYEQGKIKLQSGKEFLEELRSEL